MMVFVAYIQQPVPQEGMCELEVFQDRETAIAFLKARFDKFLAQVSNAEIQTWYESSTDFVAVGIIRTYYTSWFGKVVERELK